MFTRRYVLKALPAAIVPGAFLATVRTIARAQVGGGSLVTVSDGHLVLPQSFVIGDLPEDEARAILVARGFDPAAAQSPCNLAVWQSGDRVVLFDAGSGPSFMPTAGVVLDSLAAIDLAPEDITDVIFTHGHPDHLWGALDDFDEPLFIDAAHYFGARESDYWIDPATLDAMPQARKSFAAGAARRLEILGPGLTPIGGGDEILPGIAAIDTPGHTPGHLSFRITDGDATALVIGDAIGNGHLALARPEWPSPADEDPDLGIRTRVALIEEISASGEIIVGFHLPDGGLGRIVAADDGYAFTSD